ncbi:hypothetical protein OLMES_0572 [Oleiphilus messinensis]|uniref:DUF3047 domain-containing protein n=1 Tax=Oleiphilus messinensis TaxID=141451 RepID=A0A1Y0I561_9GAMM|nr:DUF3047 domain-containing protein [Oleiphilus messinensis]ARU54675.1 hypothetical protein OLMES_0572 [Oleiphilus messinensis]
MGKLCTTVKRIWIQPLLLAALYLSTTNGTFADSSQPLQASGSAIPANPVLDLGFDQYQSPTELARHWSPLNFPGIERHTHYQLIQNKPFNVIEVQSNNAASALIYRLPSPEVQQKMTKQTPYLNWQWKVDDIITGSQVGTKAGDDYPARIYIAFHVDPDRISWFDKVKRKAAEALYGDTLPGEAINLIWSSDFQAGSAIANAYTDKTIMVAADQGKAHIQQWRAHSVHIPNLYRQLFQAEPPAILGVAIMTDTDNTNSSAKAWFGPISFSARPQHPVLELNGP